MKRLLLIILTLVIIVVIAAGVFIATFDINTYKPIIISRLESATGGRVEIGRIFLAWKGRILLGIEGLNVYVEESGKSFSILSFDRAEVALELVPLLRREPRLSSISLIRPNIYLIRSKDGRISIPGQGKDLLPGSVKASAAPVALGFNISSIEIRDGTVRLVDMTGDEPADITVKRLDADINNVSSTTPVRFAVKAALASERQDLSFSGTAGGFLAGSVSLKDFEITADLAALGSAKMLKALPALGRSGLKEGSAGILKSNIRQLQISGGKVSGLSGDLRITDGRLVLSQVRVPIEKIALEISADGPTVILKSFSAQVVNGVIKGNATIEDAFTAPRTTLRIEAEATGFSEFLTSVAAVRQNLDGDAKISFAGTMSGGTWPEMSKTLSGRGDFSLEKGIIMNANVLDQTMGALTVFPNLINTLQGKVSAPEQQAMGESFTVLKPLRQSFTIDGGYIIMPDLILQSEYADMRGDAKVSFAGDLSGSGIIRFAPGISGAMLAVVPQMRAITDPQGLVTFPIAFKGGSGSFKVIPDTKYIGKRIAIEAAGDAVSGYLKKATEVNDAAQKDAGTSAKPPKLKDFLKAIAEESRK